MTWTFPNFRAFIGQIFFPVLLVVVCMASVVVGGMEIVVVQKEKKSFKLKIFGETQDLNNFGTIFNNPHKILLLILNPDLSY